VIDRARRDGKILTCGPVCATLRKHRKRDGRGTRQVPAPSAALLETRPRRVFQEPEDLPTHSEAIERELRQAEREAEERLARIIHG